MKYELRIMAIALSMILASLFMIHPAYAQVDTIGQSQISPASPLYFLKSFKEILELKFAKSSQEKGLRYFEFATRRIKEVKSLINVNRADLIPPVMEKYWSSLNKVLSFIDFKDETLVSKLIDKVANHIIVLDDLETQTDNPKAKIAIRAAVYKILNWNQSVLERIDSQSKANLLSKITDNYKLICNFLSKEASKSALNQTEKATLSERVRKCLEIKK